jgi:murein tripeptide amidase MpaA
MVRTISTQGGGLLRAAALAAIALCLLAAPAGAATDFTKYHTHAELTASLKAAVTAHGNLAKLVSIGKSREGRDIWAIELANPTGTPVDTRPALLITANLEGDHLVGSELALFIAESLLNGYASDAAIKARLDEHVIYIVPRVNPDGAELMFAPVKTGARTNLTPFDADNDARLDEDGPEDLNKDGFITVMRVKDPAGPYMISPEDPRLMKKADPAKGEKGGWAIYSEGFDNDGDGFINEDGPGGVDINRNFMHQYPYFQPDAGRYMVSETETRALLEYALKHRNIAAVLTFGENDNLIAATPKAASVSLLDFADQSVADARKVGTFVEATGMFGMRGMGMFMSPDMMPGAPDTPASRPAASSGFRMPMRAIVTTVNAADTEYLKAIADKYRALTGLTSVGVNRTPAGAFSEYGYFQYGVPSLSTPGWGLPSPAPAMPGRPGGGPPGAGGPPAGMPAATTPSGMPPAAPAGFSGRGGAGAGRPGGGAPVDAAATTAESIDQRLLQWMDAEKIDGFVAWTKFTHPTLGEVEIGGFKPYATTNPPASKLTELGASHTKFVLHLTSLFPKITVAKAEATKLATGVYRVKADIENGGFLPTALAHGVTSEAVRPTMVQLEVAPETIISGSAKTNYIPALAGSGGRQTFDWIISGKPGTTITVKVVSQKGGSETAVITLQ